MKNSRHEIFHPPATTTTHICISLGNAPCSENKLLEKLSILSGVERVKKDVYFRFFQEFGTVTLN